MEYVQHNLIRDYRVATDDLVVGGESDIISISFKNIGSVDAVVGQFPLKVGDPLICFGNDVPHLDKTTYRISFNGSSSAGKRVICIITRISQTFVKQAINKC